MKKEWVISQEAFDTMLDWLDTDRERAGSKYEAIRLRLIKIFTCRGCQAAEELADETINRVIARIVEIANGYQGDPALYFYGVAQKVFLEDSRKSRGPQAHVPMDSPTVSLSTQAVVFVEDIEPEYRCLEQCLERLLPENRDLVVRYYQQERQAKIDHRKMLASELGIAVNALRLRAHRIRLTLQRCVVECLEQQPAN